MRCDLVHKCAAVVMEGRRKDIEQIVAAEVTRNAELSLSRACKAPVLMYTASSFGPAHMFTATHLFYYGGTCRWMLYDATVSAQTPHMSFSG